MNPMMAYLNCVIDENGSVLVNMGAFAALEWRDGENPTVVLTPVMGDTTLSYGGKEAAAIIAELRRQLPPPVDPNSAEAKIARLRR